MKIATSQSTIKRPLWALDALDTVLQSIWVLIYLRIASLGLTSMHNDETSDVDAGRAVNNEIIFSSK